MTSLAFSRLAAPLAAVVVAAGVAGTAFAVDDPIKARQDRMEMIGDSMKALGQMAKGEKDYDSETATKAVQTIHDSITGFTDLFPAGSESGGDTEAAPAIWTDMEGFEKAAMNLKDATEKALPAAGESLDALRGVLGDIGKNCKGCHENFRVKKS